MLKAIVMLALLALPAAPVQAQAPPSETARAEVGVLTCEVEPKTSADRRMIECTFDPADKRPSETYVGHIGNMMDSPGHGDKTVMAWEVLAETPNIEVGALAGSYTGTVSSADEGKNAKGYLVGGVNDSISLLPLSVSADQGVNLAGVEAELQLKTVKA